MGTALLKMKIMPASPEADLEEIKIDAKKIVEKGNGKNVRFEEEPIAFGLKAVIVSFDINESYEIEPIEIGLSQIKNISSAQVIDMRRSIG